MTTTQQTTIETAPVKEVIVQAQPAVLPSKIGSEEFVKNLVELFTGKHAWRSSATLATKLGVDIKELETFLNKDKRFIRRVSENEGSLLYAVLKRVSDDSQDKDNQKTKVKQKSIFPQDRYALACLNLISEMLEKVVEKHALKINDKSEEALSHLTKALHHVKSGTVLLAQETNANPNHLLTL